MVCGRRANVSRRNQADKALDVGERIKIGANIGVVRSIEPIFGGAELHLVAQLWRRASTRSCTNARKIPGVSMRL
jgi:hypothetical protein